MSAPTLLVHRSHVTTTPYYPFDVEESDKKKEKNSSICSRIAAIFQNIMASAILPESTVVAYMAHR